jgi:hypothetical protein
MEDNEMAMSERLSAVDINGWPVIKNSEDGGVMSTLETLEFGSVVGESLRGKEFNDERLFIMRETVDAGFKWGYSWVVSFFNR